MVIARSVCPGKTIILVARSQGKRTWGPIVCVLVLGFIQLLFPLTLVPFHRQAGKVVARSLHNQAAAVT